MVRQFRDAAGVEWQVYLTERRPTSERRDQYLPEAYRAGWLVFESAAEKRRLAPAPADWAELSDHALEGLCAIASPQAPRSGTLKRAPAAQPADVAATPPEPARVPADVSVQSLRPRLDEATRRLADTIDEVCDAPRVEQLDTGELIRVEETLAIAADAAREAVSIRQKMHTGKKDTGAGEP